MTAVASVTIENLFYTASVCAVLVTGTWLLLQRANVPDGLERIAELGLAAIVAAGIIGIWIARARPAILSRFAPIVSRLAGRSQAPAEAIRDVEAQIYAVPQWPIARLAHVASWQIAFHIAAVAEVWVVLAALVPNVTIAEAFLLESAGRFVTVAFKFVPYRLGHRRGRLRRRRRRARPVPGDRRDPRARPTPAHHDPQCLRVDPPGPQQSR